MNASATNTRPSQPRWTRAVATPNARRPNRIPATIQKISSSDMAISNLPGPTVPSRPRTRPWLGARACVFVRLWDLAVCSSQPQRILPNRLVRAKPLRIRLQDPNEHLLERLPRATEPDGRRLAVAGSDVRRVDHDLSRQQQSRRQIRRDLERALRGVRVDLHVEHVESLDLHITLPGVGGRVRFDPAYVYFIPRRPHRAT